MAENNEGETGNKARFKSKKTLKTIKIGWLYEQSTVNYTEYKIKKPRSTKNKGKRKKVGRSDVRKMAHRVAQKVKWSRKYTNNPKSLKNLTNIRL